MHSKILKALPGGYNWSPEDLATYKLWRRWLFILYGSIGVAAIATAMVGRLVLCAASVRASDDYGDRPAAHRATRHFRGPQGDVIYRS